MPMDSTCLAFNLVSQVEVCEETLSDTDGRPSVASSMTLSARKDCKPSLRFERHIKTVHHHHRIVTGLEPETRRLIQRVVSLVWKDVQGLQNICGSLPSTMCRETLPPRQHEHTHTSARCSCANTPVHSLSVLKLPGVHLCLRCVCVCVCLLLSSYLPLSLPSTLSSAPSPPALS